MNRTKFWVCHDRKGGSTVHVDSRIGFVFRFAGWLSSDVAGCWLGDVVLFVPFGSSMVSFPLFRFKCSEDFLYMRDEEERFFSEVDRIHLGGKF